MRLFNLSVLLAAGIVCALVTGFGGCASRQAKPVVQKPTRVEVDSTVKNLGDIEQHSNSVAVFRVRNVGDVPLVLSSVKPDCHCTGAQWDTAAVMPNAYTEIRVTYDSEALGFFQQSVDIELNTAEQHLVCLIRGKVVAGNRPHGL
ncbi:DUF1573 domain-containing protein [Paraflavitalea sp. CAU 1676]|uniref:DUF1573 domain-containing protein n=1 Tax=Paraflavitalea sp. CAU 1676 TaxID=3032598 RepID=UPI0023DA1733|nr:DUF1573 domain-containing protein [Paraflavitalea sp. CAU 1676]MDF2191995.1 DUF1573 domain-containing protein [Paraflavitalea sp. CAU 1676]